MSPSYRRFRYELGKPPLDHDSVILVEVGPDGYPEREVGLNSMGEVGHRYPDERFPDGRYGLFTDYPIEPSDGEAGTASELEAAWLAQPVLPVPRAKHSLLQTVRRLFGRSRP